MKIKSFEKIYTGGGVFLFLGQLTDNNYFIAVTDFLDVRIINDNPFEANGEIKEDTLDYEWQEKHLVRDIEGGSDEAKAFFDELYSLSTF